MSLPPVLLIGEAPGEAEAKTGYGFVGASGIELLRMLHDAGVIEFTQTDREHLSRFYRTGDHRLINLIWEAHDDSVIRTNVFRDHPQGNALAHFCGTKAEGIPGLAPLLPSKYVLRRYEADLTRLGDTICDLDPNLIVALGNTPLWALTNARGVGKLRGTTRLSTHCVADYKLLVCYHPAAVIREWSLRPTTVADLQKILRERESGELQRPRCEIWIEPDVEDIQTFFLQHTPPGSLVSVDIETSGTQITCIGFAPRRDLAIVIPFHDPRRKDRSYWESAEAERLAWELIRTVLEDQSVAKTFQNGMYDIAFLLRAYGIKVRGARHDTMLLHHALQPESPKALGYLGSVYTDHGPWKTERKGTETIKRDE